MKTKIDYRLIVRIIYFEILLLILCAICMALIVVSSGVLSGYFYCASGPDIFCEGEDDLGGGLIVALSMGVAFLISIIVSFLLHLFLYKKFW